MVSPKTPSSLSPSTISCGYSSACSRACAFGMISLSTKLRTVDRISVWMSVRSAVCARRAIARSSGTPVSVVTGEYGARGRSLPGVPGHAVTVAAVRPRLVVLLVAVLLLAGCGSDGGSSSAGTTSSAAGTSSGKSEPEPAKAEASREAAADPAAATDPQSAALSVALRATDLPAGWTVQANPVPDGDLSDNPSLAGICGFAFTSETHRTAKYPVVGVDGSGTA